MSIIKAYRDLGMTLPRYIFGFALPLVLMGCTLPILATMLFPALLRIRMLALFFYAFPGFCAFLVLIYPVLRMHSRLREIDNNMNLFITRLGVLAATNLPRKDLIREVAKAKEYGALSDEMERVYNLMEYWNYTLPEAARYVARITPSVLLSDFLARAAHSLDAGEDFRRFVEKEQRVVMTEYGAKYRESIKNLDLLKDLLIAMIISMVFLVIFAYFLPLFLRVDMELIMMLSVFVFVVTEVILLFVIKVMLPKDDVWHNLPRKPKPAQTLRIIAIPACAASAALAWFLFNLNIPLVFVAAISFTPMLAPGLFIKRAELDVERCDVNYDAFVRSIGSTVETVGGTLEGALARLQRHDFGPLTIHVRRLYRRLVTKIDKIRAWHFFAADTGSNLITKFNDMYVEGITLGGAPVEVGRFVSNNFVEMLVLRKERYQAAAAFNGVLYGLGLSIIFALSLGVSVMRRLNVMFGAVVMPERMPVAMPLLTTTFNVEIAQICAVAILIVHSIASAVLTRIVSGRHPLTPLVHFVGIVWLGALTFFAATKMMAILFEVGG
jgi:flagellar protein FlaJ